MSTRTKAGKQVAEPAEARLVVFAVAAFMLVMAVMPPLADYFKNSYQHDLLLPRMAALASSGQPDGAGWLVRNDRQHMTDLPPEALRTAADAGHSQSRYLCALVLSRENDARATSTFQLAATAGDPDATLATATQAN